MHVSIKVLTLAIGATLVVGLPATRLHAQERTAQPDQGSISGLGIRNIGSAATMHSN